MERLPRRETKAVSSSGGAFKVTTESFQVRSSTQKKTRISVDIIKGRLSQVWPVFHLGISALSQISPHPNILTVFVNKG